VETRHDSCLLRTRYERAMKSRKKALRTAGQSATRPGKKRNGDPKGRHLDAVPSFPSSFSPTRA